MIRSRRIAFISTSVVLGLVLLSIFGTRPSAGIDDGTPWTLYMIRMPTDDVNHLSLYPEENPKVLGNISYRVMVGQKGSGQESISIMFPPVQQDNKLQYETNVTIVAGYEFNVFARPPQNPSDLHYIIEVVIELDHTRDGDYEDEIRFRIEGEATNQEPGAPTNINGEIQLDTNILGDLKGGRMRVSFNRLDNIDTPVWLYTGYLGHQCMINLPYSKYVYVEEGHEEEVNWTPFLVGALIIIAIVVGYVMYKKKDPGSEKAPIEPIKRGSRRGRR